MFGSSFVLVSISQGASCLSDVHANRHHLHIQIIPHRRGHQPLHGLPAHLEPLVSM